MPREKPGEWPPWLSLELKQSDGMKDWRIANKTLKRSDGAHTLVGDVRYISCNQLNYIDLNARISLR